MEIRSCRSCGRLFNYLGGPCICESCARKLEQKFQDVRQYIKDHPDAPVVTVSKENDVSVKQITQWIREERLEFSQNSDIRIACEKCGKLIRTGRFCNECKGKMASEMESMKPKKNITVSPKTTRDKGRMRFLDK